MPMQPHILYLHGFASSPQGRKITDLRTRLATFNLPLHAPDLNVPSFEKLSLTEILKTIANEVSSLPAGPVYLIGSSMGGLAALHFYDQYRYSAAQHVEKILFLAPAFQFFSEHTNERATWVTDWKQEGTFPFFHFGLDKEVPVHYGLVEDARRYNSQTVNLDIPALIYHGLNDETVPYITSVEFAETRDNVALHLLDSEHTLVDKIDDIWAGLIEFFELR